MTRIRLSVRSGQVSLQPLDGVTIKKPYSAEIQRYSLLQLVGFSLWLESNKQLYGSPRANPKRLKIKKME